MLSDGEKNNGPILIIKHIGEFRDAYYIMTDEISGQVSLSFGEDQAIEGVGHGTYESSKYDNGKPDGKEMTQKSTYSNSIQDVVFDIQGRMTDDCAMETTIIEDRLSGIKTAVYNPTGGITEELGHTAAYEIIPESEFIEGAFTIPFKAALYTLKTTRDEYEWTWTFQIQGIDDGEVVHGCTFTVE